jgi:hypothetical protein
LVTTKNYTIILLLSLAACRQTYEPPIIASPPNYLVVEGFIENNGTDSTVFTLSHTVKLDSNTFTPEPGATVTVEGSDNSAYTLGEMGNGNYGAALTSLNGATTYRLHILTTGGKQYASDYVPLVFDPPIDSINWVRLDNASYQGVRIYTNTHDPQNNTHYYRWKYQECWEFHSPFESAYNYVPGQGVVPLDPITDFVCWRYHNSTDIVLANSTQLAQDVIYEAPVVFLPLNSQQLSVRYSILVTQYALTEDAFSWWQILQKNTEQIGSLFGVQPSANTGNIHCLSDTAEQVLGYVGGGNSRSQRIFITNDQVLPWDYNSGCVTMSTNSENFGDLWTQGYLPYYIIQGSGTTVYAFKVCIDCTLSGTNIRPSFW